MMQTSRWARMANIALMRFLYRGREIQPACEYPPDNNAPGRPKRAIDSGPLDALLAAKRETVIAAEQSEADGDPWEPGDFVEVLNGALLQAREATGRG